MRVSNPLANSYTKNQADNQFLTVDISGSESGTPNPINANTLEGHPASYFAQDSEVVKSVNNNRPVDGNVTIDLPFVQIKLLWENESPTASFSPQTISVDTQSYGLIMILCTNGTSIAPVVGGDDPTMYEISGANGDGGAGAYQSRKYQIKSDGVQFYGGTQGGVSANNAYAIPIKVYGIKF